MLLQSERCDEWSEVRGSGGGSGVTAVEGTDEGEGEPHQRDFHLFHLQIGGLYVIFGSQLLITIQMKGLCSNNGVAVINRDPHQEALCK
jgi:hypothetical protein